MPSVAVSRAFNLKPTGGNMKKTLLGNSSGLSLLCFSLVLLAVFGVFTSRAVVGIYLHDGSSAVFYRGGVNTINQPFSLTAGASLMVICVEEVNTTAANIAPATISWNGILLTNIAYQSPSTTSLFRGLF
jgi:hypothetical protein